MEGKLVTKPKTRVFFKQDSSTLQILIDEVPCAVILKKVVFGFYGYKQNGVYYVEVWKKTEGKELMIFEERTIWVEVLKLLGENFG